MLSWPNSGVSIAESAGICMGIVAIFVLIREISARIAATCGQMLVSVNATFSSSGETGTKMRHEQNCAATGTTSGAMRVIFGKTLAT